MIHPNLANTNEHPYKIDVSRAKGIYIYDTNGTEYIDLISGIAVSNIGHCHPAVVKAVKEQVEQYMHVMVFGEFYQKPQVQLAEQLAKVLPSKLNKTFFVNSGTEANEGALKLAKRYTGRSKIVACKRSYHGSTHGSLSVSGNEHRKSAFKPLLPDIHFMEFGLETDLELIDDCTACVIMEPIQGDAGVRIPSKSYMHKLREKCSVTGTLLIFDEIQTGFGRTGKLFAFEHFDVVPDILTVAKGMGGGMPIGAFIADHEIMHTLTFDPPLGHITTFGGHPVNCVAALANLEVITSGSLLEDVERKGQLIESLLQHPAIVGVRRKGMLFAIEMENASIVQQIVQGCKDNGVLSFWFLSCPESFRIAPPLIITDAEIEKALKIVNSVMNEVFR